jgi:hypothetical protein
MVIKAHKFHHQIFSPHSTLDLHHQNETAVMLNKMNSYSIGYPPSGIKLNIATALLSCTSFGTELYEFDYRDLTHHQKIKRYKKTGSFPLVI